MSKDSPSKTFSKVILSCFIIIITIICISFLTGNSFLSKISRGVLDRTN